MKPVRLTEYTRFSGCGAKLGPGLLDKALCGLSQKDYPNLLADYSTSEDCGIVKINDTQALIQTIDFFPPIVDDPFLFGRIAAANALSDIYAMGGTPIAAVSVVCFPKDTLDISYLRAITEGGLDALNEADTPLVGGHSIDDPEPKFGYSVTGLIDIDTILFNNRIHDQDLLYLTKPIGTGLINTALRGGIVSERALEASTTSMSTLNRKASMILNTLPITACTDVTGFGLLGHACEMVIGSGCTIQFEASSIPLLPDVKEYLSMGLIPEGTYRNKEYRRSYIKEYASVDPDMIDLLFDPQTSGGLLFSIPKSSCSELERLMRVAGVPAVRIGEVIAGEEVITLV